MHESERQRPVAMFKSATVFPPGQPPIEVPGDRILAAGIDQGVIVLVVAEESGEQTQFLNVPMKVVKGVPSGLVAPVGPRIIP